MAPLALYRTYRPGTLAEVIGQDHVTGPLGRALTSGRIHHAYLFSGPRGCGKTSTARILARSLNCETGPTATPCGLCQSCVDLAPNGPGSLDVVELDAATHRGIDDAKELRERAIYAPVHSQFRIYILDEAHQLTPEAANALLKLIEEPPAHLRFIFATTEPDRIIPTIRSRTFHYGFRLVPARVLVPHMARVCEQEGIPADPTALSAIARAGGGSVRDSLSLLGQLLAGAGPEGLTQADAVAALGLTDGAVVDDFVAAVAGGSAATMFAIVDRVVSAGHDPRRFAGDVLDRIRDLIVVKAVPDAVDSGLVDVAPGEAERLMSQAQSLGQAQLSQVAGQLSAGLSELKGATAPRLQLELLCARLALPASGSDPAALAARVEVLERHWAQRGLPEASAAARGSRGPGAGSSALAASVPATAGEPVAAGTSGSNAQPDRSSPRTGASSQAGGATGGRTQAAAAGDAVAMPAAPVLRSGRGRSTAPADPVPASPAADSLAGPGDDHGVPTAQLAGARAVSATLPGPGRSGASPAGSRSAGAGGPGSDAASPGRRPSRADAPPPAVGTGDVLGPVTASTELTQVREGWIAILERLATSSRVAWTLFHQAVPLSVDEAILCLAVPQPGNVMAIMTKGHDERLRQVVIDVVGLDLRVSVVHDPGATAAAGGRAASGSGTPGPDLRTAGAADTGSGSAGRGAEQDEDARGLKQSGAGDARTPTPGASHDEAPRDGGGSRSGSRGAAVVREARNSRPAEMPDEASPDDPDLPSGDPDGLALITRELGARPIGEIDHS